MKNKSYWQHVRKTGNAKYAEHVPPPPAKTFTPHSASTTVTVRGGLPKIVVTHKALQDMFCIVDLVDGEVGWIGAVEREENVFTITEIFLPLQKVDQVEPTCELTPEGIAQVGTELMASRSDGMDLVNSIRFWGHSHGDLKTHPSPQDLKQLNELAEPCGDYFIAGILNRHGRMEFIVYLFEEGVIVNDVEWSVHDPVDPTVRGEWEDRVRDRVSPKVHLSSHYTVGKSPSKENGSGPDLDGSGTDSLVELVTAYSQRYSSDPEDLGDYPMSSDDREEGQDA